MICSSALSLSKSKLPRLSKEVRMLISLVRLIYWRRSWLQMITEPAWRFDFLVSSLFLKWAEAAHRSGLKLQVPWSSAKRWLLKMQLLSKVTTSTFLPSLCSRWCLFNLSDIKHMRGAGNKRQMGDDIDLRLVKPSFTLESLIDCCIWIRGKHKKKAKTTVRRLPFCSLSSRCLNPYHTAEDSSSYRFSSSGSRRSFQDVCWTYFLFVCSYSEATSICLLIWESTQMCISSSIRPPTKISFKQLSSHMEVASFKRFQILPIREL